MSDIHSINAACLSALVGGNETSDPEVLQEVALACLDKLRALEEDNARLQRAVAFGEDMVAPETCASVEVLEKRLRRFLARASKTVLTDATLEATFLASLKFLMRAMVAADAALCKDPRVLPMGFRVIICDGILIPRIVVLSTVTSCNFITEIGKWQALWIPFANAVHDALAAYLAEDFDVPATGALPQWQENVLDELLNGMDASLARWPPIYNLLFSLRGLPAPLLMRTYSPIVNRVVEKAWLHDCDVVLALLQAVCSHSHEACLIILKETAQYWERMQRTKFPLPQECPNAFRSFIQKELTWLWQERWNQAQKAALEKETARHSEFAGIQKGFIIAQDYLGQHYYEPADDSQSSVSHGSEGSTFVELPFNAVTSSWDTLRLRDMQASQQHVRQTIAAMVPPQDTASVAPATPSLDSLLDAIRRVTKARDDTSTGSDQLRKCELCWYHEHAALGMSQHMCEFCDHHVLFIVAMAVTMGFSFPQDMLQDAQALQRNMEHYLHNAMFSWAGLTIFQEAAKVTGRREMRAFLDAMVLHRIFNGPQTPKQVAEMPLFSLAVATLGQEAQEHATPAVRQQQPAIAKALARSIGPIHWSDASCVPLEELHQVFADRAMQDPELACMAAACLHAGIFRVFTAEAFWREATRPEDQEGLVEAGFRPWLRSLAYGTERMAACATWKDLRVKEKKLLRQEALDVCRVIFRGRVDCMVVLFAKVLQCNRATEGIHDSILALLERYDPQERMFHWRQPFTWQPPYLPAPAASEGSLDTGSDVDCPALGQELLDLERLPPHLLLERLHGFADHWVQMSGTGNVHFVEGNDVCAYLAAVLPFHERFAVLDDTCLEFVAYQLMALKRRAATWDRNRPHDREVFRAFQQRLSRLTIEVSGDDPALSLLEEVQEHDPRNLVRHILLEWPSDIPLPNLRMRESHSDSTSALMMLGLQRLRPDVLAKIVLCRTWPEDNGPLPLALPMCSPQHALAAARAVLVCLEDLLHPQPRPLAQRWARYQELKKQKKPLAVALEPAALQVCFMWVVRQNWSNTSFRMLVWMHVLLAVIRGANEDNKALALPGAAQRARELVAAGMRGAVDLLEPSAAFLLRSITKRVLLRLPYELCQMRRTAMEASPRSRHLALACWKAAKRVANKLFAQVRPRDVMSIMAECLSSQEERLDVALPAQPNSVETLEGLAASPHARQLLAVIGTALLKGRPPLSRPAIAYLAQWVEALDVLKEGVRDNKTRRTFMWLLFQREMNYYGAATLRRCAWNAATLCLNLHWTAVWSQAAVSRYHHVAANTPVSLKYLAFYIEALASVPAMPEVEKKLLETLAAFSLTHMDVRVIGPFLTLLMRIVIYFQQSQPSCHFPWLERFSSVPSQPDLLPLQTWTVSLARHPRLTRAWHASTRFHLVMEEARRVLEGAIEEASTENEAEQEAGTTAEHVEAVAEAVAEEEEEKEEPTPQTAAASALLNATFEVADSEEEFLDADDLEFHPVLHAIACELRDIHSYMIPKRPVVLQTLRQADGEEDDNLAIMSTCALSPVTALRLQHPQTRQLPRCPDTRRPISTIAQPIEVLPLQRIVSILADAVKARAAGSEETKEDAVSVKTDSQGSRDDNAGDENDGSNEPAEVALRLRVAAALSQMRSMLRDAKKTHKLEQYRSICQAGVPHLMHKLAAGTAAYFQAIEGNSPELLDVAFAGTMLSETCAGIEWFFIDALALIVLPGGPLSADNALCALVLQPIRQFLADEVQARRSSPDVLLVTLCSLLHICLRVMVRMNTARRYGHWVGFLTHCCDMLCDFAALLHSQDALHDGLVLLNLEGISGLLRRDFMTAMSLRGRDASWVALQAAIRRQQGRPHKQPRALRKTCQRFELRFIEPKTRQARRLCSEFNGDYARDSPNVTGLESPMFRGTRVCRKGPMQYVLTEFEDRGDTMQLLGRRDVRRSQDIEWCAWALQATGSLTWSFFPAPMPLQFACAVSPAWYVISPRFAFVSTTASHTG